MPISVKWEDEHKTIIYYEINGEWSVDEAWEILNGKALELIMEENYVPDTIMNFSGTKITPLGLLNLWRRAYDWMKDNRLESSIVTFVQAPLAMKGIGDTLRNLRVPIMRYMFFVDSIEEGKQLIADYRVDHPRQRLDTDQ